MANSRRVILDVDTGTDDAVAIMLAGLHPDLCLIGCTTTGGNLPVDYTTANTLRVLDHIGRSDVPVFAGRQSPLSRTPRNAEFAEARMAGNHPEELGLPPSSRTPGALHAAEWLVETLRAEACTVVATGPLTNIAAAVAFAPDIVDQVDELVIMGGANSFGNASPIAEANIWHDAIAADIVMRAGFKRLVLVTLDATHQALFDHQQADELMRMDTPAARAAAMCIEQRIVAHDVNQPQNIPHSAPVHDAVCVAYLVRPDVIQLEQLHVGIELSEGCAFGATVIDVRRRGEHRPNALVALNADRQAFFDLAKATLARTLP